MKTKKYGINIFSGIDNDKPYFVVEISYANDPRRWCYRNVTEDSKKRLERLITTWDKRVYFDPGGVTICAFNPNA